MDPNDDKVPRSEAGVPAPSADDAGAQRASDEAVLDWLEAAERSSPSERPGRWGNALPEGAPLEGADARTGGWNPDPQDVFELSDEPDDESFSAPAAPSRRKLTLPLVLFVLTCFSTFFVGMTTWAPGYYLFLGSEAGMALRRLFISHWDDGLLYMCAALGILLCHEMGHFAFTVRHRIRATLPFFLPIPITPIGTLGAVIGMDGLRADRKQIFDIGIAGPLAGLIVAIPVLWAGVYQLDLTTNQYGMYQLDMPLIVRAMAWALGTPGLAQGAAIWQGQLNPLLMAGWVGLLVTGLNMLPVSQLDGGHVIYALFGRSSRWIARGFMLSVIAYVIFWGKVELTLMIGLILLIGTDHPPTSNDAVKLTWFRKVLAYLSLTIPVLCIPPRFLISGS